MTTRIQTFNGNIGIGTNDPGSYKLRVEGSVKANSLEINGVTNAQVPIGLVAMWYGSVASIPDGWALCDGTTGITRSDGSGTIDTPNLVNKFVRGAEGDAPSPAVPGQNGGGNTVTLTTDNLAPHSHTANSGDQNASHSHSGDTGNQSADHSHSGDTGNQSANHSHPIGNNNRNHSHRIPDLYYQPGRDWHQGQGTQPQFGNVNWYGPYNNANTSNISANHGHPVGNNNRNHSHEFTTGGISANHTHPISTGNQSASHSHPIAVGSTGNAAAVNIENPYYILAYIMKV
jgi:microcystin-dependent protein